MIRKLFPLWFSLLSWAWLSNTWGVAGALLLALTAAQVSSWRWQVTPLQFVRFGDLTTVLILLLLLNVYILQPEALPIFVLLKWLPALFAPLLLVQFLSTQQNLPLAALFYSRRKQSLSAGQEPVIDFSLPYASLTILAAGAANVQTTQYFMLSAALFIGILWPARPRHYPLWSWLIEMSLALALSYFGYQGLYRLNSLLEEKSIEWLSNWQADPFSGRTSIGDIGQLKLSDKIEFRLKADSPLLLHQASYDRYFGDHWTASARRFLHENPLIPSATAPLKKLEFFQQLKEETVLALPDGVVKISGLDHAELRYSEMGVVMATAPPQFNRYQVLYNGLRIGEPRPFDLKVPKQHLDWLQDFAAQMQLNGLAPAAIASRIRDYFQQQFFYSLYLGKEADPDLALRDFMLNRRAGHCEYFATATVFLLRYAGIPARLANGYSVSEYDSARDLYIVRRRHAHAWAIAYIDNHWIPVDSTPSQWLELENQQASFWQPLSDFWSDVVFHFRQWQLNQTRQDNIRLALVIALLLTSYLAWRIFGARQRQSQGKRQNKKLSDKAVFPGTDSEFYRVERCLQNTPYARQHNESVQHWVARIQTPELDAIYRLHYRLRFDPSGLSREQRQKLRQMVSLWLQNNDRSSKTSLS